MEAVADSRSRFRRLLTTRGFVALVAANALGFGGEQMRIAAQSWWILDEGGSNAAVGLAAGLRVIPVVLISLYAGVMIDRFGGKRVLLVERFLLVALPWQRRWSCCRTGSRSGTSSHFPPSPERPLLSDSQPL